MPFTSETARLHRGPGGRRRKDSKEVREAKRLASDIARDYIETHIQPVLNTYLKLAEGWTEKRFALNGEEYEVFKYDGQTTRHFVDKILPDEQIQQVPQVSINIAQAIRPVDQSGPQIWGNGLQIRIGGGNGQNGNGADGA